jgi:hypothetical protein
MHVNPLDLASQSIVANPIDFTNSGMGAACGKKMAETPRPCWRLKMTVGHRLMRALHPAQVDRRS